MPAFIHLSRLDQYLIALDQSLKTISGVAFSRRPSPATNEEPALDEEERHLSGALMRVNHVGEVCAQALYRAQALCTQDEDLRAHLEHAASEEQDHLAWTAERLQQLGTHRSRLTPLWYGGAFAIGSLAGLAGDRVNLGFVVETEKQVEAHLDSHLDRLPAADHASRAIVAQMKDEEAQHAEAARARGALELPGPVKQLMRLAAGVMTRTAHHI
ncbi:2-polyprenyl-3-methyl-6-methoxy-1,4-benzoquinone monooxygenase [Pelomonas sp. CA6]|uniref:2-polyprenyl-3-methyl-6-methoxy-1,4-benzoquinone monooxygenase n=1 Tax=Pelomonas sp. CA6 TaxID=2907999 RepID=UPI001F4C0242|nr:2-polyprenyl-3-methyl-6-methoxy-1,4-benzoquinone monooxygenase [Pelomonas sp. CA6]MCH7343276.1 2-polyprenyl-3-methyl-6-methoxy-1,4-benzoquinone monooxygenase [Pelomonas sp. CA6]